MGEDILMPLMPFRLGDLRDEIIEEVRECDFAFGSSNVRFDGRGFSIFFWGEPTRCGAVEGTGAGARCKSAGGGISLTATPALFASSCSMTWA
jgi:hypothetical protein